MSSEAAIWSMQPGGFGLGLPGDCLSVSSRVPGHAVFEGCRMTQHSLSESSSNRRLQPPINEVSPHSITRLTAVTDACSGLSTEKDTQNCVDRVLFSRVSGPMSMSMRVSPSSLAIVYVQETESRSG